MVKVLNVKQNNNSGEYAAFILDGCIKDCKVLHDDVIIVIHGYGSHGKGGVIKQFILDYLQNAKKFKQIEDFVKGEEWSQTNPTVVHMCNNYPELILHSQLGQHNSGITIVWVRKKM